MTVVEEEGVALEPADVVGVPEVEDEESETTQPPSKRRWQRFAAIVALAALAVFLVFQLFTGPVERLWYRTRQSQLAADLTTPHRHIGPGQAVGVLQIPRLGTNVVVGQGDSPERLRSGPGHRIGTPIPGQRGNSVIFGHRTSWGGPFGSLTKVKRGDYVVVQNKTLKTYVYRVTTIRTAGAGDTQLLRASRDHRLTLVTGQGGRLSGDRLIVTAVSGKALKPLDSARVIRAETPAPSLIFNLTLLAAIIAFTLMLVSWRALRGRTKLAGRLVVAIPLGAAGLLALLLYVDLLLPPLH